MESTSPGTAGTTQAGSAYTAGSSLPWHLIPTFKPGETDINDFSRRVTFLSGIWPQEQMALLAPRIAMSCEGSAFQKMVRLDPAKLKVTDTTGVALIVKTLGGVFGKTTLENRFERFERAIYSTVQKSDESHESYVARHEVQFEDLLSQGISLEDVRAYILLRNSGLTAEEKKKVIVDADGNLTYSKVIAALRLLGSKFFHEVQTGSKPTSRQKTYDVNFLQDETEVDNHNIETEEHGLTVQADFEEAILEQLHQEGDEDALVVSQFEDQILEVLQEDPSMASCFNTYIEARRKLSEKARFRGFWQPSSGKGGKGKTKNKSKGKGFNNKRSLEQRIANSQCKRCFQWGHWKAECPQRHQAPGGANPSTAAAFTGVAQHDDPMTGPWNFVDEDMPPEHAVAFVAQDFEDTRVDGKFPEVTHVSEESIYSVESLKNRNRVKLFRHTIAKCLDQLSHRMPHPNPDMNPPLMQSPIPEPLSPDTVSNGWSSHVVNEESIHFVSQGAEGIVDLGASLSVIGEGQFQELCSHLPKTFQQLMKTAPCDISFRFGNDSTVRGKKAVYIPLGQWWMKLIVVPSNTPFLIANSLFRNLGAIIDTNKQEVFFEKLQCTVPISLSERRLFMLDLVELIRRIPMNLPKEQKVPSTQFVCQCVSESHHQSHDRFVSQPEASSTTPSNHHPDSDSGSNSHRDSPIDSSPLVQEHHGPLQQDELSGSGRTVQTSDPDSGRTSRPGSHSCNDLRRSQGPSNGLREVQAGTPIQGGGQRQKVCELVRGNLQQQPTCHPRSSPAFCQAACGTARADNLDSSQEQSLATSHSDQQATSKSIVERTGARGGRDRELGTSASSDPRSRSSARSNGPDGEHDAADPEPLDTDSKCRASDVIPESSVLTAHPSIETDWLEQCLQTIREGKNTTVIDAAFFLEPFQGSKHSDNWVAQEMWSYFQTKGDVSKQFSSKNHDLMEIYCSQDSELTKQGLKVGLAATRFGLRDGDLSTEQGRRCLYDRLWVYRPEHVWMSPKCRAWCRWATFNMHRSPTSAQKVLSSREEDRVHLLLCSAIMELQHFRDKCHFHLEQPVGSHMMFQEEMHAIVENTHRATCDMCVAGQLKHPDTGKPIRKSTQIFTSSSILHRCLESLKCPRDHEHSVVAGSCILPDGKRCAVSRFTELYTRTFAHKVCKALKCSLQVREAVVALPEVICPALAGDDGKRRRIGEKQEPPEAYQQVNHQKAIETFIQSVIPHAPKVGKLVFSEGTLFQQCQELFPRHKIVAIEACKGADRYRLPPPGVSKRIAPLRWSMGCHRNESGTFTDSQWEDWSVLSRKQVNRKCPPARLLISVFAKSPDEVKRIDTELKRKETDFESEISNKRHCSADTPKEDEPLSTEGNMKPKCHSHGPLFSSLPSDIQAQVMKLHKNLGHPDNRLLTKVLKDQQWDTQIIDKIVDMVCPSCFENQKPRLARPAHISYEREFNDLVMIDGVEWTSQEGVKHLFYHLIDAATNFHIAIPAECRVTSHVIELIKTHWITWAGAPRTLMSDSAGEFCSEEFGNFLQSLDVKSVIVPAEAHWQLGRCERHGAILQNMLDKYQKDQPIRNPQDLREALLQCVQAKNSMSRIHGYTPEILVLGRSRHAPACNSNEQTGSSDWMVPDQDTEVPLEGSRFLENLARREAARKAFVSADHDQKLRRALLRQSRPNRGSFDKGQWVMFWRSGKTGQPSQWIGPGKVVVTEDQNIVWVTYLSRLYRCAPEHLRAVSERECPTNPESNGNPHDDLPNRLGTGVFQYTDLTGPQAVTIPVNNQDLTLPEVATAPVNPPGNSGTSEISEEQPDAEPQQEVHPSTAPEDVPIPEDAFSDNGDDSALSQWENYHDHWKIVGNQLHRIHREPRYRMFCPTNVVDCPVPVDWLLPARETQGLFHGTHDWNTRDVWQDNPQSHQSLPMHWTGETIFHVRPEFQDQIQQPSPQVDTHYNGVALQIELDSQEIHHCMALDHEHQVAFLASAAKKQRAEVRERELSSQDLELFLQAKQKEVSSWLSTETVRRIARSQIPEEQILRTRWVLTWKPVDAPVAAPSDDLASADSRDVKAKARLVVLGFEDPQIEALARDSPTLGRESRMLLLQYAASAKWPISTFDIQTAFLRGSRTDGRILGVEPPQEMRIMMNLKPWECCELRKSAYGLVNAPLLWYEELQNSLTSLGFIKSPLDPCLFVLPKKSKSQGSDPIQIHGMVGIHVDDGIGAGDTKYHEAIAQLENKFPFGSKKNQRMTFTGLNIVQQPDFSIEIDQEKYVEDIPPIHIDRDRRKQCQESVLESERQALRGLVGSLQYAATNSRPDISARLSFLQAKLNAATVQELLDANKLLQDAKVFKSTRIKIKSIPVSKVRFLSFSDASFATRNNAQSQKGCLILTTSETIGEWQSSDVSPIFWYSKKIARVVPSTLASEAYALSGALDVLSWLRLQWDWLCCPSHRWKEPLNCLQQCPKAYAVVDCKSLYDLLQKTIVPQCQEYRTMLESLIIKDRLQEGIVVKWVHSAAQMADSLTKIMDCSILRQFLHHGRCIIHDVEKVLQQRADQKAKRHWVEQVQLVPP